MLKLRFAFVVALVACMAISPASFAAITYKVLGQSSPSATTDTTLYTVPASTSTIVSTIVIANRDVTPGSFRIAIRPAGATLANAHYIAFDVGIPANDSIVLTIGTTLATTDVVTIRASSANMSFSIFGSELS